MNTNTETIITKIKALFAENSNNMSEGLTPERYEELARMIPDDIALADLLPALKALQESVKENAEKADARSRDFAETKKMWKDCSDQISAFLLFLLGRLGHKSYCAGDTKATVRTTEVLECNDEAILKEYVSSEEYGILAEKLPGWVKLSLSIDKNALKGALKADNRMLFEHPEWVHTRENKSLTLK